MNSQFKKGILELCVLGLILRRDAYGYELVEEISSKVDVAEGTIYPLLRRLTHEGYCLTYLQESPSGPPRKYYKITPAGLEFFHRMLADWRAFNKNVNAILSRGEKNDKRTIFG
jgi:PadR family transcriptional regulator PadR